MTATALHNPSDTAPAINPGTCPLCGQPNGCAMERQRATGQPQPPCWCTEVKFEPALLARIPAAAQRRACVCHACATAA